MTLSEAFLIIGCQGSAYLVSVSAQLTSQCCKIDHGFYMRSLASLPGRLALPEGQGKDKEKQFVCRLLFELHMPCHSLGISHGSSTVFSASETVWQGPLDLVIQSKES